MSRVLFLGLFFLVLPSLVLADRMMDMAYMEDSGENLTLEEVMNHSNWTESEKYTLNFGLTESAYWMKFHVELTGDDAHILEINNLLLDDLRIFVFDQKGTRLISDTTGRCIPFANRTYKTKSLAFDMPRETGVYTCYLRAQSLYTLSLPIFVEHRNTFFTRDGHTQLLMGFIFGLCILIIIYNLLLYLLLRDRASLYYVLYIIIFWYYNSMVAGLDIQYFYPKSVHWPGMATSIFAGLTIFFSVGFVREFFKTKYTMPIMHKVFFGIGVFGVLLALYPVFFPLTISYKKIITLSPLVIMIPIMVTGITRLIKGDKPAIFFVLGWSVLLLGVVMYGLRSAAVLPSNLFTTYGILIGAFGESFLLSFSITFSIRLLQKEKDEARQQQILYLEEMQEMRDEANRLLEKKVKERTAEVEAQKEELTEKNKQIIDSINYAQRIQNAILPPEEEMREALGEFFVFYKPRDIVSGDFYWFHRAEKGHVLTIADCTGHGVPGAFMSFLGFSILNEAIVERHMTDPGEILNYTHRQLIKGLRKETSNTNLYDGIDLAMLYLPDEGSTIHFSGAQRPLWKVSGQELFQYKGIKKSIGDLDIPKEYTTESIDVKPGDVVYLFSDGFPDQIGAETNKKYMTGKFRSTLLELSMLPLADQQRALEQELDEWQGEATQMDDILVFGMRIT